MSASSLLIRKSRPHANVKLAIGPIELDAVSREHLIESILDKALTASSTHHVATANAQFYVLAESDFVFRDCLNRAEFVCADGFSMGFATQVLHGKKVDRLTGVDLVEEICKRGAGHGLRVFFFGGRSGSASALAEMMTARYPGLHVAGVACPPMGFEKSQLSLSAVLNQIRNAKPHVILVALGAPKQELFIDQYLRNLGVPVAIGVGGSFEILTGVTRRAPEFIQRAGCEWLYRLGQEPRRLWRRYVLGNPEFLWLVSKYWFRARRKETASRGKEEAQPIPAAQNGSSLAQPTGWD
jgi:N-acetylglucosaminyldiphosphoundecaprenol N-acetyl-beta-D-mannosaminyltransferase